MSLQKSRGDKGENIACRYLINKGYTVLARNYKEKCGEIDIIATTDAYIVFAEVKTRKSNSIVSPVDAVNKSKRHKIILTAQEYLIKTNSLLQPRFDIIEIYIYPDNTCKLKQIENAFESEEDYALF